MTHPQAKSNSGPGYATHAGHTITIEPVPKRISVTFGGETVADSGNALLLRETGHDPVYYFPRADVASRFLEPTDHETHCPFKGNASYWTLRAGGKESGNAVWSYKAPYNEVAAIAGHLAFYADRMDGWFRDGEKLG